MPTLPNMSLITPTLGGDSGTWDDKINACLGLIDAHDHTSGKGVQVPVSGLNINADFAMSGYAVTGLGSIALNAVTALTTGSKRLFVNAADNELYWRTNSGTNVKLTDGTSINTTLVGGIVGDYSTVGAAVAYDDANKRYTLKTQTAAWARLATGPVRIYEYDTTESVYVEHAAAAALAASYTVTWPAALPASTAVVQISSAGAVSFSNTLPDLDTVTLQSNKNLVLQGTGIIKHGTWQRGCMARADAVTGGSITSGASALGTTTACLMAASTTIWVDVTKLLQAGESLTSVLLYTDEVTGTANSTFDLHLDRPSIGLWNSSLLSAAISSRAALPTPVTLTVSGSYTYVAGDVVRVVVSTAAASTRANYSVYANFTRP